MKVYHSITYICVISIESKCKIMVGCIKSFILYEINCRHEKRCRRIFFYFNVSNFLTSFLLLTVTVVPISPTLSTSTQLPTPCFLWLSSRCRLCLCIIYALWLSTLSSFIQSPSPLTAVSLFHISMLLFLFCSSVYFIH